MAALVGVLLVGLGCLALLVALVSRVGAYAGRGLVLICVGVLAFCLDAGGRLPSFSPSKNHDRLRAARRERDALSRSLHADVLPLIERCNRELGQSSPALPHNEAGIVRQHVSGVLAEAMVRRGEQERAIAELDAAIGVMERDVSLTQVKAAERGSALARTTIDDIRPTTHSKAK